MRQEIVTEKSSQLVTSIAAKAFFEAGAALKTERLSFRDYIPQAWHIVEPANAYLGNWHIDCIAEHLEAVTLGQIQNLCISLPPRNLKSVLASKLWPTWSWTTKPWLNWIFISYSQLLSQDFSKDRRDIVQSDLYRRKWGSLVQIAADQNQKSQFMNTARGRMIATSVGGTLTGKGADIIVIDDGIDPERAASEADRNAAIRFVKTTISTRLNDKRRGSIVNIAQRTHKEDITGVLLAEGIYTHLELPAIAPTKTVIEFPLSKRKVTREPGNILHPEREDAAVLANQKKRMNIPGINAGRSWEAQYQQNPTSDEGAMFKRVNWRFFQIQPEVTEWQWTWDTAMEEGEENDYTVGLLLGYHSRGVIVADCVRGRMQYPELEAAVKMSWLKHPAHILVIENKVSGQSLAQALKRDTDYPVIAYPRKAADGGAKDVRGDKVFRAQLASKYQDAQRVALPEGASWVPEFVEEFAEFPNSTFKDQVDAFSLGINQHYQGHEIPAMGMFGNGVSVVSPFKNGNGNGNGHGPADWM